eukprot:SAG22_NODE_296_length_12811_cov_14.899780_14_plen_119_part_00
MDSLEYNGSVAQFSLPAIAAEWSPHQQQNVTADGNPSGTLATDELFAVMVRSGNGSECGRWCLNATATERPHTLVYNTRAYLNPRTKTGPSPVDLLAPVILRLRPSAAGGQRRRGDLG